jgi:hypothetical protein
VAFVDPAGQAYPALHVPEHDAVVVPGALLYKPAAHTTHDCEAGREKYPGAQLPLHNGVDRAVAAPYTPAGQSVQDPAPDKLYRPAAHSMAVAFKDPAGHAHPAVHAPSHSDDAIPTLDPNCPARHKPVHDEFVRPGALPYVPSGHGVHDPAPDVL